MDLWILIMIPELFILLIYLLCLDFKAILFSSSATFASSCFIRFIFSLLFVEIDYLSNFGIIIYAKFG